MTVEGEGQRLKPLQTREGRETRSGFTAELPVAVRVSGLRGAASIFYEPHNIYDSYGASVCNL